MPITPKRVSIIIPFYNEARTISSLFAALWRTLDAIADVNWEIICVDDGSTDTTLAQLIALSTSDPRFKIIELSRNFGKEAALTAGLDASRGDAVIPMDADLQDPPDLITEMLAAWENGAEVGVAKRSDSASVGLLKRQTAGWFYRLHNRLADIRIPENVGDFRLMDRVVVDALKRLPERQRFMKGLFAWVGFRTEIIEYSRPIRDGGKSKFTAMRLWNLGLEGVTSFSMVPLKIWTYIGVVCALLTFSYAIFIVIRTLVSGIDVPGYASLLVAILFFGSMQLISVGVLGEYIGRIYIEAKQRPTYLIRMQYGKNDHA
jgi:glycosyltransferase involved in cell wall biosynthesis